MGIVKKNLSLLLVVLAVFSLMMVKPANAQSIPMPSVPEFTIRYLKASYNISTITNGETIIQQIDNSTVEVVIKNQLYNYSVENVTYLLYYNVQTKSHFTQDWIELYPLVSQMSNWMGSYSWYIWVTKTKTYLPPYPSLPASNSSFTTLSLPSKDYPINTDFQVKALIGHNSTYFIPPNTPWNPEDIQKIKLGFSLNAIAYDSSSDWSTTQTVSLPEPSSTPTMAIPTIKGVPAEDFQNVIIITLISGVIILVSVLVIRGKLKKTTPRLIAR